MTDETLEQRPPGWYDDGTGVSRWWTGRDWTGHTQPTAPVAASESGTKVIARHPLADDPTTIWSAIGRPLSGIGAGRYRLTADMFYFERGTLSTNAQQVQTWQIHDVDASQSMTQKARNIGTITLRTTRHGVAETVTLMDVPDFREGVRLINDTAREAGERKRRAEQTQHVNYSGMPPQPAALTAAPQSNGQPDLLAKLTELGALRQQGLLDEAEFAAAKRLLLGL